MFIELDLRRHSGRVQTLINTNLVEEIFLSETILLIIFTGGENSNRITFDICPETEEFYKRLYEKIKYCLVWEHKNSNVIEMRQQ